MKILYAAFVAIGVAAGTGLAQDAGQLGVESIGQLIQIDLGDDQTAVPTVEVGDLVQIIGQQSSALGQMITRLDARPQAAGVLDRVATVSSSTIRGDDGKRHMNVGGGEISAFLVTRKAGTAVVKVSVTRGIQGGGRTETREFSIRVTDRKMDR